MRDADIRSYIPTIQPRLSLNLFNGEGNKLKSHVIAINEIKVGT